MTWHWHHMLHRNGFSPVCVCWCLVRLHFTENATSHTSYGYGFSPVVSTGVWSDRFFVRTTYHTRHTIGTIFHSYTTTCVWSGCFSERTAYYVADHNSQIRIYNIIYWELDCLSTQCFKPVLCLSLFKVIILKTINKFKLILWTVAEPEIIKSYNFFHINNIFNIIHWYLLAWTYYNNVCFT
jgi:hypothetical protein